MLKNKKKKRVATNRGITLIALVVTIVVLLILAGITITAVMSEGGIFSTAKRAQDVQDEAAIKEKVQIMLADAQLEKLVNNKAIKNYFEEQGYTATEDTTAGTVKITVDGYNVIVNSSTLEITQMQSNTNTSSPIKFYQPYRYTIVDEGYGEGRMDYIFHEDGSCEVYQYQTPYSDFTGDGSSLPAGTFLFTTDGIYIEDEKYMAIGTNGSYVGIEDEMLFELVPTTVQYLQYGETYVYDSSGYGSGYFIFYEDGSLTYCYKGETQTMPAGSVEYKERTFLFGEDLVPVHPDGTKFVLDGYVFRIGCAHLNTEIRNESDTYTGDTYCTDCGKLVQKGE